MDEGNNNGLETFLKTLFSEMGETEHMDSFNSYLKDSSYVNVWNRLLHHVFQKETKCIQLKVELDERANIFGNHKQHIYSFIGI
jgi:hypothetical protein